jgi:hypothetical protein
MRSDQYNAKTASATVGLKIAAVLPGMKPAFSAAINELVPIEQQTQALLNDSDVPTIQYPFYLNYSRELWKLKNQGIAGASLTSMAKALKHKYAVRGLDSDHLIEIADTIFNITVT